MPFGMQRKDRTMVHIYGIILSLIGTLSLTRLVKSDGLDTELCTKNTETCQCGENNGYFIHIDVKHCPFFYRGKPYCDPCDEIKKEVRCAPYRSCQECDAKLDGCVRCPPLKYGKWCTLDCKCKNGSTCQQDSGRCVCPSQRQGRTCEQSSECPPPPLSTSRYHPQAVTYKVGTKLTYSCSLRNEFLEGPSSIECLSNAQWSNSPPKCRTSIVECPLVTSPIQGSVDLPKGRLTEGVTLNYSCNANYSLIGTSVRTCQKDGTWSGDDPVCELRILCKQPDNFHFGNFLIQRKKFIDENIPGANVTFTCNKGYTIIGNVNIQCKDDGRWSGTFPFCAKDDTVCPDMGELIGGSIKVNGKGGPQAYLPGTELEFSCEPLRFISHQNKAICLANGTWSSSKPFCINFKTCTSLSSIANGKIEYKDTITQLGHAYERRNRTFPSRRTNLPEDSYHIGTEARFSCETKFYELVGSKQRICEPSGEWNGRQPICIPICGQSNGPRAPFITHGIVSEVGHWPWQVGLATRKHSGPLNEEWDIHCGGSLISERWVVTAAHCVTFANSTVQINTDELQLYFGKYYRHDKKDDSKVEIRKVEQIIVHKYYHPFTFDYDIALLHLNTPVKFSSRIQTVCLPKEFSESNDRVKEGNKGIVTGWGMTETGNFSDVLQYAEVPVVSNRVCEQEYKKAGLRVTVSKNMICAGHDKGIYDACNGDSGGPLVFFSEAKKQWYLEGIVSWGSILGCGNPRQYAGYVRVQEFYQWIHDFI